MCQNNYSITACPNCPGELVCLVDDDAASCQCPSGLVEKEPGKCRPPIGEYLLVYVTLIGIYVYIVSQACMSPVLDG